MLNNNMQITIILALSVIYFEKLFLSANCWDLCCSIILVSTLPSLDVGVSYRNKILVTKLKRCMKNKNAVFQFVLRNFISENICVSFITRLQVYITTSDLLKFFNNSSNYSASSSYDGTPSTLPGGDDDLGCLADDTRTSQGGGGLQTWPVQSSRWPVHHSWLQEAGPADWERWQQPVCLHGLQSPLAGWCEWMY